MPMPSGVVLCYVDRDVEMGLSPVQEVLLIIEMIHNFRKVSLNWNRSQGV